MKTNDYARILSRGKSFEFTKWCLGVNYSNDCFKQDWVVLDDALLVCIKNHVSTKENQPHFIYNNDNKIIGIKDNEYWEFVFSTLKGERGLSPYELAKEHGYVGTEDEWLFSLKGIDGKDGKDFTYEDFTEEQINNLKGPQGPKGEQGPRGYTGTISFPTLHIDAGMHLIVNTEFENNKERFIIDDNGHLNLLY